jgi:large conductance mechanosensitive channel
MRIPANAATERGSALLGEFRAFISRGNVIDLAIGIIIGAAFTTIVNSLVKDIILPLVGLLTGGLDFSNWFVTLGEGDYATLEEAKAAGVATLNFGLFLNAVLNFLIVSFAIFLVVKQINRFHRRQEAAPTPPPRGEVLLEEIRDLLKSGPRSG